MKRLFFILAITLVFCKVQAQISDAEAKLLYQQAEDAYNNGDFCTAEKTCGELNGKIGKFTPKVLYLELKSKYKIAMGSTNACSYKKAYGCHTGR